MTSAAGVVREEVDDAGLQPAGLAIRCRNLRKVFGDKVAVRGLTLDVPRGEAFGFLGPNGAGKSTSIKMLLGLVKPTRGSAYLLDKPISDVQARRRVGFLPEHFRFYDWLTAAELLRAYGELSGVSSRELKIAVPEMIDVVGLAPHAAKQLRHYSKGMLQRIGLAQALIHKPDVIFLDEPTSGLDPIGRRLVRDLIRLQKDRNATVFLNSHLLGEVEATCDRVAFIRQGVVIETAAVSDYEGRQKRVMARVRNLNHATMSGLSAWATEIKCEGTHLHLKLLSPEFAPRVVEYLVLRGTEVHEFTLRGESLEDRFLEIVTGDAGL